MGHSNASVTLDVYTHSNYDSKDNLATEEPLYYEKVLNLLPALLDTL